MLAKKGKLGNYHPVQFALQSAAVMIALGFLTSEAFSSFTEPPPTVLDLRIQKAEQADKANPKVVGQTENHPPCGDILVNLGSSEPCSGGIGGLVPSGLPLHKQLKIEKQVREKIIHSLLILYSVVYIATAFLFRLSLLRFKAKYPNVQQADQAYLYVMTAHQFLPHLFFFISYYLFEIASLYMHSRKSILVTLILYLWFSMMFSNWWYRAFQQATSVLSDLIGFPKKQERIIEIVPDDTGRTVRKISKHGFSGGRVVAWSILTAGFLAYAIALSLMFFLVSLYIIYYSTRVT